MDGTLVDTEVLWWEVTEEVAASLGHRLSDADAPEVVGRAVEDTAAHLIRVAGADDPDRMALSATAVAAALTAGFHGRAEGGAPLRPGVRRLPAELEQRRVPFALVSASPTIVVDSVVAGALADVPFFFTISADDTVRTKPHPDPCRAAAERFGAAPGACVAVEDSPDGSASAQAAGCVRCWWCRRCCRYPRPGDGSSPRSWRTWILPCSAGVFRPESRCVAARDRGPDDGTEGSSAA